MSEKSVFLRGLVDGYEFSCVLPGSGERITYKPINTEQMKKVLVYEQEDDSSVIDSALDKLIASCVTSDGFDISKMYLQDRYFLLIELRKASKGGQYQFNYKCVECEFENIGSVNITELPIRPKKQDTGMIVVNDKMTLEVSLLKREDQLVAAEYTEKKYGKNKKDAKEKQIDYIIATYANAIKKIHAGKEIIEDVDFDDKFYILNAMPVGVFDSFKSWFQENDFGIEFKEDLMCQSCGHIHKLEIEVSDFFD